MARLAASQQTVQKPPSLARDAVACLVLLVVGNVCASVTWEHYFGAALPAKSLAIRQYAATPASARLTPVSARLTPGTSGTLPRPDLSAAIPQPLAAVKPATHAPATSPELPVDLALRKNEPADSGIVVREGPRLLGAEQDYACPNSMRLVDAMHCPLPVHECVEYLNVERDRCKQYASSAPCVGAPSPKRFCIDEYEYPNQVGSLPMVWVNFQQAAGYCATLGKRLCTSSEWELACEGPERTPYATGFVRDSTLCNFDRPNIVADNDALSNPRLRDAESARVDQREAAGARPNCVSYFGVHDMTGNVDEWVQNDGGYYDRPPYKSALKGGYWGKVRNRCRPTTTDHNAWHQGYQIGFRCCTDATVAYAAK